MTEAAEAIVNAGGVPTVPKIVEAVRISPYSATRAIARLKKNCRWPFGALYAQHRAANQVRVDAERMDTLVAIAEAIIAEGGSPTKTNVIKRMRLSHELSIRYIRRLEKIGRWPYRATERPRARMSKPRLATDAEIARNIAQALPDAIAEAQRLRAERVAKEKAKRLAAGTVKGRCDEAVSEYRRARRGCRKLTKMVRGMMEAKDATL